MSWAVEELRPCDHPKTRKDKCTACWGNQTVCVICKEVLVPCPCLK